MTMHISLTSRHFISLRSKYSSQQPIEKKFITDPTFHQIKQCLLLWVVFLAMQIYLFRRWKFLCCTCVTKWMIMFRYTSWVNSKECCELLMIFLDLRSQMWLLSRVRGSVDCVIGFIDTYTYTVQDYRQLYIYRYYAHFQFTVVHAGRFSVFSRRTLATGL
jgi:hypothetical protein